MPVTVHPAPHVAAREWTRTDVASSSAALFKDSCPTEYTKSKSIIQSSFQKLGSERLHPSNNGFVRAAVAAYCQHHHLTIRPEDVWFAILTQLSLFVNANAEAMRPFFVAHEGQEELWVKAAGTIHSVDMGALARQMSSLLSKNVNDPELHPWIMPAFSTTTDNDRVVASIIMMGALQKFFSYGFQLTCGLPSVTLLGTRDDWLEMQQRLEKLPQLGKEPTEFYLLLKPVLTQFVESFDSPEAQETKDFWQKIAHESGGSGPHYLSGWITAFCFWDQDGKSMHSPNGIGPSGPVEVGNFGWQNPGCQLGGALYHKVDLKKIPSGCTSVPVKVDDNGTPFETRMVAGSMGIRVTSSGGLLDESRTHGGPGAFVVDRETAKFKPYVYQPATPSGKPGLDSLQPESGWWMYELKEEYKEKDSTTQGGKPPVDDGMQEDIATPDRGFPTPSLPHFAEENRFQRLSGRVQRLSERVQRLSGRANGNN